MENYLQVDNISKSWGDNILFSDLSFNILKGQKIALIARNGAGKTTLLKAISDIEAPDSGKVTFFKDIKTGHLLQEPKLIEDKSVLENIIDSKEPVFKAISDYEKAVSNDDKDLMQTAFAEMDKFNAWDYESKIKTVLGKLKIFDTSQIIKEMSGGQRKRVALAAELLKDPDFLILDEPTNHLDVDMIEWLENYLTKTNLTLLMVTHDRYFLDNVCNHILELDNSKIYTYKGNYSYYLEKREERLELEAMEVEKAQNLLRTEKVWMSRMPKARGTKSKSRIDNFHKLKEKASNVRNEQELNLDFKSTRMGGKIINLHSISKSFGDLKIIENFSYKFEKFEKLGIIGNNGSGKSTFLNLLTENLQVDSGEIEKGETINIGYYNQKGIQLDEDKKIIEVIKEIADHIVINDKTSMSAAQFLNYFLFPYDTHYTYVSKLSGGERRRLYLLTVLMKNPNFLILDEPTNDLDIMTLGVLENYLEKFQGCLIIVSHDRFFMDNVVDHLFVFEGDGLITDFPGNYSQYRIETKAKESEEKKKEVKPKKEKPKGEKKRKLTFKEKREYEALEGEISDLEEEKSTLEAEVSSGTLSPDDLVTKSQRIGEIIDIVDEKEMRWLELNEIDEA